MANDDLKYIKSSFFDVFNAIPAAIRRDIADVWASSALHTRNIADTKLWYTL